MDAHTLRVLEYHRVLQLVQEQATSPLGEERIQNLKPNTNLKEVEEQLAETKEALDLLRLKGELSFRGLKDMEGSLKRAEIGGMLQSSELVALYKMLVSAQQAVRKIREIEPEELPLPILRAALGQVSLQPELRDRMERTIDEEGEILDHASPELSRLRSKIHTLGARVRSTLDQMLKSARYQKMLQDPLVTLRNDRYCLPVKQEYRHEFGGLVHDQSASGATVFMEPNAVVSLNNSLRECHLDEEREVERILYELSAEVAEVVDPLRVNMEVLAHLDVVLAKARFGRKVQGHCAHVHDGRHLQLKQARHPLIPSQEIVPINLEIGEEHQGIIVTGPNTGGKTVTLKTVGLFALMTQSGLPIPANDGSFMPVFQQVFADIGDEQSIEQSLSTFSSHMTNIVTMLKRVDEKSLILLDELGAGTDPIEGAALAISILEEILQRQALFVATTHYSELKMFAHTDPRVVNASVEFNVETLRPTYRLLVGIPGRSNAFAIAARLGLPDGIIERAKSELSQDQHQLEDLIATLTEDRRIAEERRLQAESLQREAAQLQRQLQEKVSTWEQEKAKMRETARREARSLITDAKHEAEEVLVQLREWAKMRPTELKEHQLTEAKKRLNDAVPGWELQGGAVTVVEEDTTIQIGDEVFVQTVQQKGEVVEALSNDEWLVQVGALKMKVGRSGLKRVQRKKQVKQESAYTSYQRSSSRISPEIDLRGKMVEEALAQTDKYLDDALMSGFQQVSIIHGKGTGALRSGITQFLQKHKHVKSFRLGGYREGGTGVTVVELQ
ncbi:endonuclease MutS2 [Mechercharimyces sp. CAU 1602]|uniref:endonuclease MutS2 n=1 Tax=Mechercharimyces sp. CAU 1602 TaxID=2973933 RepID=UPI002163A9E9|nr:endonuclease MutS2 [Mechercharimyces sp. CAU 1602]MCS1351543.1 endonuclease MutS2 [Mechercharimyces sp. CAU 1602]